MAKSSSSDAATIAKYGIFIKFPRFPSAAEARNLLWKALSKVPLFGWKGQIRLANSEPALQARTAGLL